MTKKELLQFLNNHTFCNIGPSELHGVGVIAIRSIPAGINPFVGTWNVGYRGYTIQELNALQPEIRKLVDDFFVLEKGKIFIPTCGLNGLDISYYLNHAENPNCISGVENTFLTNREIQIGE